MATDTIAKYKDIVSRLKGLLVETQNKLQTKSQELDRYHPDTSRFSELAPVALVRGTLEDWVLLEGAPSNESGKKQQFWVPEAEFIDLNLSTPDEYVPLDRMVEIEEDCEKAKGELARVERDFRQYRIRSETILKQREAEVEQAKQVALEARASNAMDGPMQSAQDRTLVQELKKEVESSRKKLDAAYRRETQLDARIAALEQSLADAKGNITRPSPSPTATTDSAGSMDPSQKEGAEDAEAAKQLTETMQQLERSQAEFRAYRRRAMALIKEKDAELKQLKEQGKAGGNRASSDTEQPSNGGGGEAEGHSSKNEYLKNVMVRYMCSNDEKVRYQLEAAIATILDFGPADVAKVKAARQEKGGGISSLLSMFK